MATPPAYDVVIKLLLLGNTGVGKSALLIRFSDGEFLSSHTSTLGIDFKVKTIDIEDRRVKLQIWDTAGQERFRSIATSYFRGVKGFLLVYDVTDRSSFDGVEKWLKDIRENATDTHKIMLIANKVDLPRVVSTSEGQESAKKANALYMETSAKECVNVTEAFQTLATDAIHLAEKRPKPGAAGAADASKVDLTSSASTQKKSCC